MKFIGVGVVYITCLLTFNQEPPELSHSHSHVGLFHCKLAEQGKQLEPNTASITSHDIT